MIPRSLVVVAFVVGLVSVPMASSADTARFRAVEQDGQSLWKPASRTIAKGDRIVWVNPTDRTHTVTAYSGPWAKDSSVPSGDRTAKRFRKAGRYKFRCMVKGHSALSGGNCQGMCGTVVVR